MLAPTEPAGLFANNVSKPVIEPTYLLSTSGEFQRMLRCQSLEPATGYSIHQSTNPGTINHNQERVYIFTGPLGTRKSVLAASIVNQIQETEQDAPLFHFFLPSRVPDAPLTKPFAIVSGIVSCFHLASSGVQVVKRPGAQGSKSSERALCRLQKSRVELESPAHSEFVKAVGTSDRFPPRYAKDILCY